MSDSEIAKIMHWLRRNEMIVIIPLSGPIRFLKLS